MPELPTGTVTFVFTDIEGSTRLLQEKGERYADLLEDQRRIIRETAQAHGGVEFGTEGDASFLVFPLALGAVEAAADIQRKLQDESQIRVRMGVHTGEGFLREGDYVGIDVHRAARVAAAGHGGQVLLSEPTRALVRSHLPPGTSLRDLGEHRLKDLARPERLYQLDVEGLEVRFPPLRTVQVGAGNLPTQLTRFVGREVEIEEVRLALRQTRLLTLTGPGGTGKTRLSIAVGDSLRGDFVGGVWFVALAPVTDPDLVPALIAEALGLPELRGDARTPLERVADHLADRELLLVLDNFEQVMAAAGTVADLLRAGPKVKVLVTSREALHLYGEREYPVPPLRLPDPRHLPALEALSQYESVALFVDRATAVRPEFEVTNENAPAVAEICARLDGLPLAIELAAARIRLLGPEQILARLSGRLSLLSGGPRDLPARQQTLRGAIAWSHDLLDEAERRLFARLGVFKGGFLLEDAETVCGPADELGLEVLDGVTSLAEKSLLVGREEADPGPRFGMLETIREFAVERLDQSGEGEDLRRRHAEAYLDLAERAEAELLSRRRRAWLDRLEPEHDNFRSAVEWSLRSAQPRLALSLVAALWRFWQMRGHIREGRMWIDRALALPGTDAHPRELTRAVLAAGGLAYWAMDESSMAAHYERALQIAQGQDVGKPLLADALYNAAWTAFPEVVDEVMEKGRAVMPGRMRERLMASLALFEEAGDVAGMGRAHWGLGNVPFLEPSSAAWREALEHLERALELSREAGDVFTESWSFYLLGVAERNRGDIEQARTRFAEALRLFQEAGDLTGLVFGLEGMAAVAWARGRVERAIRIEAAAAAIRASSGTGLYDPTDQVDRSAPVSPEDAARARSEGEAMTVDEAVAYALGEDRSGPGRLWAPSEEGAQA